MKTAVALPLLLGASLLKADWIPGSPLLRIGSELDLHFTAKARAEYTDNLFYRATPTATLPDEALSFEVTPGLDFQYGRDLPLSASLTLGRTYVDYVDSALNELDDELDALAFSANYDGGGPLLVSLGASYIETARNNAETIALIGEVATLVRQSSAGRNLSLTYGLTEKLSATLGARSNATRYYGNPAGLNNSEGYGIPLDLRFKFSEKVTAGLSADFGETDIHNPGNDAFLFSYERRFYGLNLAYQPTDKLQAELRAGLQQTEYDFGSKNDSPSYSLSLTHSLTEKLDQSLSIGQEATTSAVGSISDSFRVSYGLNFANSQAWRSSFNLSYNDSSVDQVSSLTLLPSTTDVRSARASVGVNYNPDDHWSFGFNYSHSWTIDPTSYGINQVSLEASLRW